MAAPKSLEPDDTPLRVRGMMNSSTVWSRADTTVAGEGDSELVVPGMFSIIEVRLWGVEELSDGRKSSIPTLINGKTL